MNTKQKKGYIKLNQGQTCTLIQKNSFYVCFRFDRLIITMGDKRCILRNRVKSRKHIYSSLYYQAIQKTGMNNKRAVDPLSLLREPDEKYSHARRPVRSKMSMNTSNVRNFLTSRQIWPGTSLRGSMSPEPLPLICVSTVHMIKHTLHKRSGTIFMFDHSPKIQFRPHTCMWHTRYLGFIYVRLR